MAQDKYQSAGSFNWVCPAGVFEIQVECWGGGGTGSTGVSYGGYGGGGGAYAKKNVINVFPGVSYPLVVGGVSGDSYFINTSTVLAKGGASGEGIAGGQAGSCVGDVKYSGGNGNVNSGSSGGGGGGGAGGPDGAGVNGTIASGSTGGAGGPGDAGLGGAAGTDNAKGGGGGRGGNSGAAGQNGGKPGGGGGGGGRTTAGVGAPGQVIITYTPDYTKMFQMF
jgi:hypothetical protein